MYCYNDKKICCVTKKYSLVIVTKQNLTKNICNKTKFDKKYLLPNKIFCYTNRMVSTIFFLLNL